ncbi:hypothetical protein ACJRO7_000829 [Eucalyptus globulus]|uniref:Uncharacterized protein n=1 Tax=Eucalyptus globulus TaxID=34317 RepID=A0ABD3LNX7_EUCGL
MNRDTNHCAITVAAEARHGWSSRMEERFEQTPTLLKPSANNYSCCIFRVPRSQVESNAKAYKPYIVSLMLIKQHKPQLFFALLDRTRDCGAGRDHYFEAVASLETGIRDSYLEAMILDACFYPNDPLFSMRWIFAYLMLDLLLIENQIPFIVLKTIYDLSNSPSEAICSLDEIALRFFNHTLGRLVKELESIIDHLELEHPGRVDRKWLQLIPSTKQLQLAGIKFEPREGHELIRVDSFFLNCVAFEHCCRYCSSHITSYMILMRCLVRLAADAEFLPQCCTIANFLGTDEKVARFFNDLAKDIMFSVKKRYLVELFGQVNRYHQSRCHIQRTGIMREYFGSSWSFISAAAAFILLVLTVIQPFFTVYPYYHTKK